MCESALSTAIAQDSAVGKAKAPSGIVLLGMLVLSALAALIDEHLLSKMLMRVVGSSVEATTAVLVAFMGGMGAGATLARRLLGRAARRPFLRYGLIELGIGASALALLPVLDMVVRGYGAVARSLGISAALFVLRFAVVVLVVSVPAVLTGMTLPLFLAAVRRSTTETPLPTPRFYAANTLGAALGVLVSTYALIPGLGIAGALGFASACNLAVAIAAFALQRGRTAYEIPSARPADGMGTESWLRREVLIAFGSGLLALALASIFFRLLAMVIGSTVYAFGLMLFVFLLGNGLGSWLASHRRLGRPLALAGAQAAVGLSIMALLPLWDHVPRLFRTVGQFAPSFLLWEGTRMAAVLFLLGAPTLAMGCAFGLLLRRESREQRTAARVAQLYAANLVGGVLGALSASLVLAPGIGSHASLVLIAVAEAALALLALVWETPRVRRATALSLAVATIAMAATCRSWNMAELMSGSNVYFSEGFAAYERIRYLAEDRSGGMVTVIENQGTRTLLVNGNFEGDDSSEVPDQQVYALFPMLFVRDYGAGLNVGVGTGNTLAVMAAFPFKRLDAIDLSASVLTAARHEFRQLNRDVLSDARVRTLVDDGRNFLLTGASLYDLISVQVSSISIAGEADLYSVEFYRAARQRLTSSGVFKQWLQLHHIATTDVARVLASMRAVFPEVTLWMGGHQGVIVASPAPLRADVRAIEKWASEPRLAEIVKTSGLAHPFAAFGRLYLATPDVDLFLADVAARHGLGPADLVAHDNRPVLEYSTPHGNLLREAVGDNMESLRRFAGASLLGHVTGLRDENEQQVLLAWAAYERGFHRLARVALDRVTGPLPREHEELRTLLANAASAEWP
jgi:spermidine synthase